MTSGKPGATMSAQAAFDAWLASFSTALRATHLDDIVDLFVADGYWKDILAFTWEHRTFQGPDEIRAAFQATVASAAPTRVRLAPGRTPPRRLKRSGRSVIEGYFEFDTAAGEGTGFVRLLDSAGQRPRIWLLLTTLQRLHGFQDRIGPHRPTGDEYAKNISQTNWLDDRLRERAAAFERPQVLIVGAGHAGLILAARLRQLNVMALVIDKTPRVGDVWRGRYHSLTLHNEVMANHLPYLPFPETWPVWLPKDMLASWLETYAVSLELNVRTGTELLAADYDPKTRLWSATLRGQDGGEHVIHCEHLVAATGVSGSVPNLPRLEGLDAFEGEVIHSNAFRKGGDYAGKRALVIGTGNSGHDVAQDLYAHGAAEVRMVQRGPTCVVSLEPSAAMIYAIYNEGRPVDDVDLVTAAVPYPMLVETYQWITRKSAAMDKLLLDRLNAVGFQTTLGDDDTGFHMMYLRGKGGYYIDVGCSELIASGKIGVLQARDIDRYVAEGVLLRNGEIIPCDVIVLATGFQNMQENIRRMVGEDVAERVGPIWGFDENHAIRNMWRRTAQDGFWVTGGALIDSRLFSRFLAIEIKAALEGVHPDRADLPMRKRALARRDPQVAGT